MIYDIFYVSKKTISDIEWKKFCERFPSAQKIENVNSIDDLKKKSFTKFFWLVWDDVVIVDDFAFDYRVDKWDEDYAHVFKNSCNGTESYISGVALIPKKANILKKEFDFKFYVNKKEIDVVASKYQYPIRYISTYDEYLNLINEKSKSMFWCVWPDIELVDDSIFDFYFDPNDGKYNYDRSENHVYKNSCNGVESYLSGVILFSTEKTISKREFNRRFLVDKKEHDLVVSKYRYPRYVIHSYQEYQDILKNETQQMFWCVWPDIELVDDSIFDFYFDPNDGKYNYDRSITHMFKNGDFYDGLMLMSRSKTLTAKEFNYRFPVEKKEWNIQVSIPVPFEIFQINTFEDYITTLQNTKTEMFWVIRNDVVLDKDFDFNSYYVPVYDHFHRNITHVFKNGDWYDGVVLYSKNSPITKKEFDHRFPIEKKQHNIVVSNPKPFDIVFISYNETNADKNFKRLTDRFPRAKRIDGVKGIHNAHIEAAKIATTDMFWVVDADAIIIKDFNFEIDYIPYYNRNEKDIFLDTVHVWKSLNLVNGLLYGYGGVKLLPKKLILNMDTNTTDMTTSLSKNFKVMPSVSNVTEFNTDAFSTWRSAFRECVKLSSKVIDQQYDLETEERLIAWCSRGEDKPFGTYSIAGAKAGKKYGEDNINNKEKLSLINNFNWLEEEFLKWKTINE